MYYHNPAIQSIIRKRAQKGLIIFSDHGEERAVIRDVDHEEIFRCLKTGILEGEDWDPSNQATTYRMAIKNGSTSKLVVVVGLTETHDVVVTTFRKERS